MSETKQTPADSGPSNYVRDVVAEEIAAGKYSSVRTRFPPEPNGFLHIGHATSIHLNFGLAEEFGGACHLRFDDTNPATEEARYVESIQADIKWLGFDWGEHLYFASDYFQQLHDWAVQLIKDEKAYVDSQTTEQIRENRGNFYKPGVDSPFRERTTQENLALFEQMRTGAIDEGAAVLRAKIDMQHKNLNFRDPLLYRVRKLTHHRTGDDWCIYPMYDYAHGLSDAIEGITHSVCTLEFADHRPLYDWFLDNLPVPAQPRQIEFARLNLSFTMMSKRKLLALVNDGSVTGWDDPRMPTLAGMRRRGYTPEAIRAFCDRIGVSKRDGVVDVTLLEHALREHLNATSPRVMGVLEPLKVVIENFPEGETEWFEANYFPDEPERGTRKVPLTRDVYVERGDYLDDPPKKWHRLGPGREVRLRYACLLTCNEVVRDDAGEPIELRCTWDPESRGGTSPDGRKVRGTLHWVSAEHALPAQVRLYDRLFSVENPLSDAEGKTFTDYLNPDSLVVREHAKLEPSLADAEPGSRWQFERLGYFCVDNVDHTADSPVFNRTIALRDSWAKLAKKLGVKK